MSPSIYTATLGDPHNTKAVDDSIRLAKTSVESSSFFAIRGLRGTGKTIMYNLITGDWKQQKFEHKSFYFGLVPETDSQRFIRHAAYVLTGKKYACWERPSLYELMDTVVATCQDHELTFLFFDDVHLLSSSCHEMILFLFDRLRGQGLRCGMATTARTLTPELLDAQSHPAFLDTVLVNALTDSETLACMAKMELRLEPLCAAFFAGTNEGEEACRVLYKATGGLFLRMESFLANLRTAFPSENISLEEIRKCHQMRQASAASENNFTLISA